MSFKIDMHIDLVFVWSITERGEPYLELVPKNRPNDVKAEFTFDADTLLNGLNEDLASDTVDIEEWTDLANFMKATAEKIENRLKEHLNEDN